MGLFSYYQLFFKILLELCKGGSVADLMKSVKMPLNEDEIRYILKGTLKGLRDFHALSKIHRDIKVFIGRLVFYRQEIFLLAIILSQSLVI